MTDRSPKAPVSVVRTIVTVLSDRELLKERFLPELVGGGLFIPGHLDRFVGEEVSLDIAVAADALSIQSKGVVRWKRPRGTAKVPAGIGVQLSGGGGEVVRKLIETANPPEVLRRPRRFSLSMTARCSTPGRSFIAEVSDISRTGMFVKTETTMPIGGRIHIALRVPPRPPIELDAEVRRVLTGDRQGLGLRFAAMTDESGERLARLFQIVRNRATGQAGSLDGV